MNVSSGSAGRAGPLRHHFFNYLLSVGCLCAALAVQAKDVPIDGMFGYKLGERFSPGDEEGVEAGLLTVYRGNATPSVPGIEQVLVMTAGKEERIAYITASFEAHSAHEAKHEVAALGDWLRERHGPSGFIRTVAEMKQAGTMAVLRGNLGVIVTTRAHNPRRVVLMYAHAGVMREAMGDAGLSEIVEAADAAQEAREAE